MRNCSVWYRREQLYLNLLKSLGQILFFLVRVVILIWPTGCSTPSRMLGGQRRKTTWPMSRNSSRNSSTCLICCSMPISSIWALNRAVFNWTMWSCLPGPRAMPGNLFALIGMGPTWWFFAWLIDLSSLLFVVDFSVDWLIDRLHCLRDWLIVWQNFYLTE